MKLPVALSVFALTQLALAADPAPTAPQPKIFAPLSYDATLKDVTKTLGFTPGFISRIPKASLPGLWAEFKGFELNNATALRSDQKNLISLAVSSQIPCRYCTYFDTESLKAAPSAKTAASKLAINDQMDEAVGMAAETRHWSTFLNGLQQSESEFHAEVDQVFAALEKQRAQPQTLSKAQGTQNQQAATAANLSTTEGVYADIQRTLGSVPTFFRRFPAEAISGAWNEMKSFQLGTDTALLPKTKELIGLAVASQIPCAYCVYFHKKAAAFNGATEREMNEAIAMAAQTRRWSTYFYGQQLDETQFRNDVQRMVAYLTSIPR